ncbi:MAG: hypothetical protein E7Z62_06730 [Thermoplasmata archaeon]|nr:hypothetical protein [Thermoplasmata archaeon]
MVIIVVLIEIIAAGAIIALENQDEHEHTKDISKELSLIARVNTDGSGIYLSEQYDASDFLTVSSSGKVTFNKETWGGKVFGTPGASTIQHVQLMGIVQNELGMKFEKYNEGGKKSSDTVYYIDNIQNYTHAINNRSILDGGILWEPQYHYITSSDYYDEMVTTNILFPGHTCCLITGYQDFLDNHSDETIRFLAAYIKAVDFVNEAKEDPSGEKYKQLIQICKDNIPGLTEEVIIEALHGVVYTYSDKKGTSNLSALESDIASLTENLTNLGGIKVQISELGFDSYEEFAKAFIDDQYLTKALKYKSYSGTKSTVNVSAIDGDIHQIAVQVARSLGYFGEYGLDVNLRALGNGGAVAQDILSGQSDLGFMGAPPITSATVNGKKIIAHDTSEVVVVKDVSLISRVNTDGSGIYIASEYNAEDFLTVSAEGKITFKPEAWGGKVFGTPGASTIQHVQLMEIVQDSLGLKFEKFNSESTKSSDTVYFVDNIQNYTHAINNKSILDGGILWEPQYHYIVDSEYFDEMITTNQLFPGHTCCLIAGYQNYLDSHSDETVRFLSAFVEAVDYINEAKSDKSGEKYAELIKICKDNIPGLTEDVIKEALDGVVYTYSDTAGTADLGELKVDIATLAENLTKLGGIKVTLKELGFKTYNELADAFVDNSYLKKAMEKKAYTGNATSTINIAAIDGDIHQIAVQVAKSLGIFEKYGLNVNIKALANGGAVAQDLLSGQSDLGFMGAPPITSATINGKKIMLKEVEI